MILLWQVRELRASFFPFCETAAAFRSAGDTDDALGAPMLTTEDGAAPQPPPPAWTAVHIHGPRECGQLEVGQAVLQMLSQVRLRAQASLISLVLSLLLFHSASSAFWSCLKPFRSS